jgi:hypothetical protein
MNENKKIHTIITAEALMHYTVYKITNTRNNRFYIGKHSTLNLNDGYMGSGVALKQAQQQVGMKHFKKEILADCKSEEQMNEYERIYISSSMSNYSRKCYNKVKGGGGHKKDPMKIRFSMDDIKEGRVKLTIKEDTTLSSDKYQMIVKPAA